jgi:predicted membrane protein
MDLFGVHADHRARHRRWPALAWPLLGAMLGALLAPLFVHALRGLFPAHSGWLLPMLVPAFIVASMLLFAVIGRGRRRPCGPA